MNIFIIKLCFGNFWCSFLNEIKINKAALSVSIKKPICGVAVTGVKNHAGHTTQRKVFTVLLSTTKTRVRMRPIDIGHTRTGWTSMYLYLYCICICNSENDTKK